MAANVEAMKAAASERKAPEAVNAQARGPSKSKGRRGPSPQERARDDALVARARRGDQQAFRALYEHYHRRAFATALGVVKDRQDAMDIVQEAFVRVHRHLDRFEGASAFYTWLYRIVMNLSIDHVRKASSRVRSVDYDDGIRREGAVVADGAGGLLPSVGESNPRRAALRREMRERIFAALGDLPEHHRDVIVLRELEHLSYEQIAERLQIPKGTVMSRLFHARRRMQAALAAYLDGSLLVEGGS